MTLPTLQKRVKKCEILFTFNNSEALTDGIIFLYGKKPFIKSSLYKNNAGYQLILTADDNWPTIKQLSEFASHKTKNYIRIAVIKEHHKPLILNNAVKIYGKAFFKGT